MRFSVRDELRSCGIVSQQVRTERNMQKFLPPVLALFLASPVSAQAATNPASENDVIIVTSSLRPIAKSQTTSALTLFTAQDLARQGPISLSTLLQDVPGLTVSRSGPAGQLTQVRLRGSEANHVVVLLNGFPATDPFTGGHDFAFDGTSLLSGVEVLRGEQSAIWGSGALGGVIDMQSGPDAHNDISAYIEAGSLNTRAGQVRFSRTDGRHAFWGGANAARSDGVDIAGLGGEEDGYSTRNFLLGAQAGLAGNARLEFLATSNHGRSEYDSDTDFDGRLNETGDSLTHDTFRIQTRLVRQEEGEISWQLGGQFLQSNNANAGTNSDGADAMVFAQAHKRWRQGKITHEMTMRGEWRQQDFEVNGGHGALQNQNRSEDQLSLAGEYRLAADPFVIQLSARQDQNHLFANAHALQAGISWQTPVRGGRLRLRYGEGVKNPGFYELFGYFPTSFIGNPDLQPEQQHGVEAGWVQELGSAHISLSVFSSRLGDEIYTDFSQYPFTAKNRTGESIREGVELAGVWQVTPALRLNGALSHVHSENELEQLELRRPEWLASVGVDWQSGKWTVSAAMNGQSSQKDTDFATYSTVDLRGFALLRAHIAYEISPGLSLYVRGENLLDREAVQVVGYASQPRTAYGGIRLAF